MEVDAPAARGITRHVGCLIREQSPYRRRLLSFRSKRLQHGALHWERREYVVVKMRRHEGRYVRDD